MAPMSDWPDFIKMPYFQHYIFPIILLNFQKLVEEGNDHELLD
jgi:hypothetical protein